jgi:hypothetical protein
MIPRKIHYCWLSGEQIPEFLQRCLASWQQVMPDYEIIKWDCSRFDIESNAFAFEAFRARKWAFAADYIRLFALHAEGGIYLDSDVLVSKRFDEFLQWDFFTAVEYYEKIVREHGTQRLLHPDGSSRQPGTPKPGIGLQAAVMGGARGHRFLADCLDFYQDLHFTLDGGGHYDKVIAPDILAMNAEPYGFRYRDVRQELRERMLILPSEIFASKQGTASSYAVHYCAGSWRDPPAPSRLTRAGNFMRKGFRLIANGRDR